MFYQSIYDTRIGLFDTINARQQILNVLLERIEPLNVVQCILYVLIVLLESIELILANMLLLCWHNMLAYYALNYAGIFDRGLVMTRSCGQQYICKTLHGKILEQENWQILRLAYYSSFSTHQFVTSLYISCSYTCNSLANNLSQTVTYNLVN